MLPELVEGRGSNPKIFGRDSPPQRYHGLDTERKCESEPTTVSQALVAEIRLSARKAGEGDGDGAGTSGVAV